MGTKKFMLKKFMCFFRPSKNIVSPINLIFVNFGDVPKGFLEKRVPVMKCHKVNFHFATLYDSLRHFATR